jgi:Tol biopolymer transport system component
MAPEQIEGIEADSRTDIFAFGAVVHEMVTGKKAFEGKSQVLLMSAIAASEAEALSKTQPAAPAALEHVVRTCLAKDPKDRWQTARDLLAELQWVAEGGSETVIVVPFSASSRKRQRILRMALAAAALLVAVTAWPASLYLLGSDPEVEFRIRMPLAWASEPGNGNATRVGAGDFAVSPDGNTIAYVTLNAPNNGDLPLFVRPISSITPQRLAGTEGATQPFWSADGKSIGFVAGGWLKKVALAGGVPQNICEAGDFFGGSWNAEGTIVFGSSKGLFRVSAQGGKPEVLTTLDASETGHYWPHFLPGGRRYLYLAWSAEAGKRTLFGGELGSKDKINIVPAESMAVYVDSGFLLFRRENTVVAQPFDAKGFKLSGEPVRVADAITFNASNGRGSFSASSGVLAYFYSSTVFTGPAANSIDDLDRQLVWADRTAQPTEIPGPRRRYRGLALAPDGSQRIAVHSHDGAGGDIFVVEPKKPAFLKITQDASRDNSSPVWSPDAKWIVYASLQKGKWGLYRMLSEAPGMEELLYESDLPKAPMSWSPDGKRIVFWTQDPQTSGDLWVLELDGEKEKKATPFLNTMYNETHGQISPDGKWIAFASNATGNRSEIYVRPFPSGPEIFQVSFNGGDWPRWKSDTRELYYLSISNNTAYTSTLFAVRAGASGSTFQLETAREVLRLPIVNPAHAGGAYHVYDVSPDGQRVLLFQMALPVNSPATTTTAQFEPDPFNGLVIAVNWATR